MTVTVERAIICDIDGTLANNEHRFKDKTKADQIPYWQAFVEAARQDKPYAWCVEVISRFQFDHRIIFITSRSEEIRHETMVWLDEHSGVTPGNYQLHMRKQGDRRSDHVVKAELYDTFVKPQVEVLFVLDDRSGVVNMWRDKGLVCLQCACGDF